MLKKQFILVVLIALSCKEVKSSSWSYTDFSAWSEISTTCSTGTKQSPIDVVRVNVVESTVAGEQETNFWGKTGLSILNNGHTMQVTAPAKSSHSSNTVHYDYWGPTTWSHHEYSALQFHFHQPSEHTFDGYRYDMELHQVHTSHDGTGYLVQGFFFMIGDESTLLKNIDYTKVGDTSGNTYNIDGEISPMDWIDQVNDEAYGFYKYDGSFTTPPCTEGVEWILWRKPMTMSKVQWDYFAAAVPVTIVYANGTGNYRPVQSIGSRTVTLYLWELKNGKHTFTQGQIAGISLGSLVILIIIALILAFISKCCYADKTKQVHYQEAEKNEENIEESKKDQTKILN